MAKMYVCVLLIFMYHAVRVAALVVIWFNRFVRSRREQGDWKQNRTYPRVHLFPVRMFDLAQIPRLGFTHKFYRTFCKQTSVSVGNYNEFKSTLNTLCNLMDSKLVCIIWEWPSECNQIISNWEITFHR